MANIVYNNFFKLIGDGSTDWDDAGLTYRALLVTATYTPDRDTHLFVSSVTNELSGGGYVRKDVLTRSITVDNANDRADYIAANITWSALTAASVAAVVIYKFVTTDADSPLIAYVDFTDQAVAAADFTLKWDGGVSSGRVFSVLQV